MKKAAPTACLILTVLLTASSCSIYEISSHEVTSEIYLPKEGPEQVEYVEYVRRTHDVIGYVQINTERNQKLESILDEMKEEAAILGGDAITDIRTNAGTGKWARIKPQELLGNAHIRANYIATVVAYK